MGRKRIHPKKPPAYHLKIGQKVTYIGDLYHEYTGKKCKVVSKSKAGGVEWYDVVFNSGEKIPAILAVLKGTGELECK